MPDDKTRNFADFPVKNAYRHKLAKKAANRPRTSLRCPNLASPVSIIPRRARAALPEGGYTCSDWPASADRGGGRAVGVPRHGFRRLALWSVANGRA